MSIPARNYIQCDQCENLVPKWFAKYAGPRSKPFGTQGPVSVMPHHTEDPRRSRLETVMCRRCLGEVDEYPAVDETKEGFEARHSPERPWPPEATIERDGANLIVILTRGGRPFYRWVLPGLTDKDLEAVAKAIFEHAFPAANDDAGKPDAEP